MKKFLAKLNRILQLGAQPTRMSKDWRRVELLKAQKEQNHKMGRY